MCPEVIWHSLEIQGKEVKDKPDLLKRVCSNVQKLPDSEESVPQEYLQQPTEKQSSWAGDAELPSYPQQAENLVCRAAVPEAGIGDKSRRTLGQQVELHRYGQWHFHHYNMAANCKVIFVTAFTNTCHA